MPPPPLLGSSVSRGGRELPSPGAGLPARPLQLRTHGRRRPCLLPPGEPRFGQRLGAALLYHVRLRATAPFSSRTRPCLPAAWMPLPSRPAGTRHARLCFCSVYDFSSPPPSIYSRGGAVCLVGSPSPVCFHVTTVSPGTLTSTPSASSGCPLPCPLASRPTPRV